MPLTSIFDAFRRLPRLGVPHLNLLLLLALAALLAHWTWRFAAPVPSLPASGARADVKFDAALDALHNAHLFGVGEARPEASAGQVTSLNLKLHGVFAAPNGLSAMAILTVDGQDQAIATGHEIVPGVMLDAVAPDHVILINRGVRERLDLEALGRPLTLADGDIPVTRQEIDRALANPQSLGIQTRAGTAASPGLLLAAVDGSGLAARLGLQSGDKLNKVNGHAVTNVQDLARQLSETVNAQRVTVVGERQGKPLILSFRLQ